MKTGERKMEKQAIEQTVSALRKRGFKAEFCEDAAAAKAYVLKEAEKAESIGFGGSVTITGLGLPDALAAAGKEILRHGDPNVRPSEKLAVMTRELTCDLFLLSANAVTADGRLVNIDGNGNRVAASIFGPKEVIFVVGRNKIVAGGLDEAVARIKNTACALNARRLGRKTPCAVTGVCADCDSPDRMCKVTVIMDRKPSKTDIHVLVVDADLGC